MADYLEFSEIAPCDEIDEVRTLLSCTMTDWKGELYQHYNYITGVMELTKLLFIQVD